MCFEVIPAKNRSTRFSHDAPGGREVPFEPGMLRQPSPAPRVSCGWRSCRAPDARRVATGRHGRCGAGTSGTPWLGGAAAFANHHAGLHVERREQCRRAVALVIVGHRGGAALPERQSRPGPIQGACIRDFSSTQSTTAGSGGSRQSPTMSVTFSSDSGSFDTLNPRVRCGFRPACARIRPTLDGEMPTDAAISARLQCVALGGLSCTVLAITFSRVSRDSRVLSRLSPDTPSSRYRACQRQTVGFDGRARRMISNMIPKVPSPSAVASYPKITGRLSGPQKPKPLQTTFFGSVSRILGKRSKIIGSMTSPRARHATWVS